MFLLLFPGLIRMQRTPVCLACALYRFWSYLCFSPAGDSLNSAVIGLLFFSNTQRKSFAWKRGINRAKDQIRFASFLNGMSDSAQRAPKCRKNGSRSCTVFRLFTFVFITADFPHMYLYVSSQLCVGKICKTLDCQT